jgi:predicted DNA-binding WGR domain protein
MRRFELIEGTASKFWEVSRDGSSWTVRYGRIGTNGQTLTKAAASEAKAQTEVDKLVREKTAKGYREVATAPGATLAAVAPKAAEAKAPGAQPSDVEAATPAEPAEAPGTRRSAASAPECASSDRPVMPSGQFQFTAAWRKALPAQRGYPLNPASADVDRLYQRVARLVTIDSHALRWTIPNSGLSELLKQYPMAQLFSRDCLGQPAAEHWHAALQLACVLPEPDSYDCSVPLLVELAIAEHGVVFAVQRYLAAVAAFLRIGQHGYLISRAPGIATLNAALARCSDAEYAAAHAAAVASPVASAGERFARGAIFNTDAALVAEAIDAADLAHSHVYPCAANLTGARLTLAQAEHLLTGDGLRDNLEASRQLALNLLREHGAAAIPLLARLYDLQYSTPTRALIADLLRACDSSDAFAELLVRIDHKEARAAIDGFAMVWPFAAMQTAAKSLARERNKSIEAWLGRMLIAHPQQFDALSGALDDAGRAVLERLGSKQTSVIEAPLDALPAVWRDPPWLRPQPKHARPRLPELPLPAPRIHWPERLRERWLKGLPSQLDCEAAEPRKGSRSAQALESLSIPEPLWSDLVAGAITDLGPHLDEIEAHRQTRPAFRRHRFISELAHLPPPLRLLLWNGLPAFNAFSWEGSVPTGSLVAHHELDALPGLLTLIASRLEAGLITARPVAAAAIAPFAVQGLGGKKSRVPAAAWLHAHAELATTALLAETQRTARKAVELAEQGLRWLAANVEHARLQQGARHFGADGEALLAAIVAIDPLSLLPQKPRPLPSFYLPAAFSRPRLADGRAVPAEALGALGTMLQVSLFDQPYAGLEQVREACTAASLDAFAWDLFEAWYQCGAPNKESWAYTAMGLLGGERCVRELTPLIRQWPGESQHARAVTGLDILAAIGSDLALMNLNGIAQKVKFKGLQERANEKIQAIADARGLSTEELADRLVPDLDLDPQGTLLLDFGPRRFTVGFDEQLRPFVRDASGARLKDLPKPAKSDDAELASAAVTRWKLLKKDAKAIASNQLVRLEMAMCSGRSFPFEVFEQFFVRHPLLRHLVCRLLWGVRQGDGSVRGFRVAEDLSYADRNDESMQIDPDAQICLPHLLALSEEDRNGFGQVFADYEILQPFQQLGREMLLMSDEELGQHQSLRFKGKRVATGSVYGLQHRGWRSGDAQDAGWIAWFEKALPGGLEVQIELDPGTIVGDINYEPKQTLGALVLRQANTWDTDGVRPFSSLDPITRSELLRDLDRLSPLLE